MIAKNSSVKVDSNIAGARSAKIDSKVSEHSDRDQEAPIGAHAHPGGNNRRLQH